MPFVNKRLGNAFVVNAIDSTKDQEHYFSGNKKHIKFKIFLDFPAGLNTSSGSFADIRLTNGGDLNRVVFDDAMAKRFIGDLTGSFSRLGAKLIINFETTGDAPNAIDRVSYRDQNSTEFSDFVDITNRGNFIDRGIASSLSRSVSWEFRFNDNSPTVFSFPPPIPPIFEVELSITGGINPITYSNFQVEFDQVLTDDGVVEYKLIDNTNNDKIFSNLNRNVMPEIGLLREVSYYGWRNVGAFVLSSVEINDIAISSTTGYIYAVGEDVFAATPSAVSWSVRVSKDKGVNWEIIDRFNRSGGVDGALGIAIDSNDNIYVVGNETVSGENRNWIVRKSTTGASGSFSYIDSLNRDDLIDMAFGIAIDSNDNIYVVGRESSVAENGNWIVRKSTTGASGSFSYIDSVDRAGSIDVANGIAIDSNDNIYVVGKEAISGINGNWIVRKSTTGASGSFSTIDSVDRDSTADVANGIAIDSNNNIYVAGSETVSGQGRNWIVRKSTTGASGSFSYIDSVDRDSASDGANGIAIDSNDNIYVVGEETVVGEGSNWIVRKSTTGASGSFSYIDSVDRDGGVDKALGISIDSNDNIYVCGAFVPIGIVRKSNFAFNSGSIGPRMLATSIGYVFVEPVSQSLGQNIFVLKEQEKFKLNNISEFPHSSGLFQMPNMVLGTVSSGKVGNTEENIIQVNYFGSVVNVMWPKQGDQSIAVKGFGDFSVGSRPGKLSTQFEPGEVIDVTEFDHLALYCQLTKETSGTLDDIEITVERRPLKSTGFAIDQTIEYTTSGSVTVARLRDLRFVKEVDYGDLSIKEIAYPIDIPLTNVKEVRISARHKNGQVESNKNFIVWGRLIKSAEET